MIAALFFPALSLAALVATDARIYLPRPGAKVTAGYVKLANDGKRPLVLTLEKVEGFGTAELHESFEKDGHAGMRRLESITIAPGASVVFQPGGNHLMLFDPKAGMKKDEALTATFRSGSKPETVKFRLVPREGEAGGLR